MKKLTSLTAVTVATLALVGCSQDGVINEAPSANQAIEFGTYLGRDAQEQTRVTEATVETIKADGFGVFAYYTFDQIFNTSTPPTAPNFMNNQKVTWPKTAEGAVASEGAWTYTPLKYWPNNKNEMVSFFAYAPYADAATNNTYITHGANALITYTVANGVTDGKDLLYAEVSNATKQALSDKVTFAFKHALARIGFTVEGAIDPVTTNGTTTNGDLGAETTITVEEVRLSGEEHTYTNGSLTKEPTKGVFYKSATLNLLTHEWSGGSTDKLSFTLGESNFINNSNILKKGNVGKRQLNKDDSYLMIIPQDFTASTTTDHLYVYIKYKVTTTDDKLGTEKQSEITNYISKEAKVNFETGNAYTINLVLGMNSVDIDVNSGINWENGTAPDVDLPANQQ